MKTHEKYKIRSNVAWYWPNRIILTERNFQKSDNCKKNPVGLQDESLLILEDAGTT